MSMGLALLLGLATASATTPGGWRVPAAVPETSVALRPVLVLGDPVGDVAQATLEARYGRGPAAVDVQLPWVYAWNSADGWAHGGPGLLRVGAYAWIDDEHIQLGAEFATPVTSVEHAPRSWGSAAGEVLPNQEFLTVIQTWWGTDRTALTTRGGLGVRAGPYVQDVLGGRTPSAPVVTAAAALTTRLVGPLGLVSEAELLVDPYVPGTARFLLRGDLAVGRGWIVADAGLQLPLLNLAGGSLTFQPIAQVRWYPVLDWPRPGTHPDSPR
ncbi:MAG: hypothetical protein ABIO70_12055 [Pseudomonadota bacterium]